MCDRWSLAVSAVHDDDEWELLSTCHRLEEELQLDQYHHEEEKTSEDVGAQHVGL